jgi:predicted naringenin-chalcone synthase
MFVLQRVLGQVGKTVDRDSKGFAVAFGPGLAAESFRFSAV